MCIINFMGGVGGVVLFHVAVARGWIGIAFQALFEFYTGITHHYKKNSYFCNVVMPLSVRCADNMHNHSIDKWLA